MSSGVAVLSLDGKLLFSRTYKTSKDIITDLLSVGTPVIVATDVPRIPRAVKKLASSFGCPVFRPWRFFFSEEKSEYLKKNGWEGLEIGIHESDALFAAQLCLSTKKRKVEQIANNPDLPAQKLEEAVSLLLSGENVKEVVRKVQLERLSAKGQAPSPRGETADPLAASASPASDGGRKTGQTGNLPEGRRVKDRLEALSREIDQLSAEKNSLELEVERLNDLVSELRENRRLEVQRDREVAKLGHRLDELRTELSEKDREIARLRDERSETRAYLLDAARGKVFVVPKFKGTGDPKLDQWIAEGSQVRTVSFEEAGPVGEASLEKLRSLNVEFVIFLKGSGGKAEALVERGIFPIDASWLDFKEFDELLIVEQKALKAAQARAKAYWSEREMEKKRGLLRAMLSKRRGVN